MKQPLDQSLPPDDESKTREELLAEIQSLRQQLAWALAPNQLLPNQPSTPPSVESQAMTVQAKARDADEAQLFRFVFDLAQDPACIINRNAKFLYVNQATCTLLGYSQAELLTMGVKDVDPQFPMQFWEAHWQELKLRQSMYIESKFRTKAGQDIPVEISLNYLAFGDKEYNCAIARDITERKQVEDALKQAEEFFRHIFESAPICIALANVQDNYRITYANPAYQAMLGYTETELLNLSIADITHPEDMDSDQEVMQALVEGRVDRVQMEKRYVTRSGQIGWGRLTLTLLRNSDQSPRYSLGMLEDITERKRAETSLRESEERLRLAMDAASMGAWEINLLTGEEIRSPEVDKLYGYSPGTMPLTYAAFINRVHPDDRAYMDEVHKRSLQTGFHESEFRVLLPTGEIRWIAAKGRIMYGSNSRPERLVGVDVDISARKLAEQEIIQNRDLREAIFNESADALFLVDTETQTTVDCNRRAIELFEADSKATLMGIEARVLHRHEFTDEALRESIEATEREGFWSREVEYITLKGRIFWGNLAIKQIHVAGKTLNLVRVSDISHHKQAEELILASNQRLLQINQELEQATRLKDEFLASMSHELRTPLNAILGMSEGLLDEAYGPLTDRQTKALGTIERSGKHLLELIDDVLDLSRIEAGKLELYRVLTQVESLCETSLVMIRQQALRKNLSLVLNIAPDINLIQVDERRICQVLLNLLSNAVKFTPDGGTISLCVTRSDGSVQSLINHNALAPLRILKPVQLTTVGTWIQFSVEDTGIGIASENFMQLFQPFMQIDSRLNRQYSGLGLGLSLVRQIVELHGGFVAVSSEVGCGSCFSFCLPETEPASPESTPINQEINSSGTQSLPAPAGTTPLILLAEDNPANVEAIGSFLTSQDYELIVAKDGQEAIDIAIAAAPDLILMDVQMPGLDGLEATRRIRKLPKLRQVPIIALTALAMPGDEERCLQAGADAYLSKPVRLKELVKLMDDLISRYRQV